MEKIAEFRVCLKDLDFLKAPFTNEKLEAFYAKHRECNSGKVLLPVHKIFMPPFLLMTIRSRGGRGEKC